MSGAAGFSCDISGESFSSYSRDLTYQNTRVQAQEAPQAKLQLLPSQNQRPCTRLPDFLPACKRPFRKGKNSLKCHLRTSFNSTLRAWNQPQVSMCAKELMHSSDQVPSATFIQV